MRQARDALRAMGPHGDFGLSPKTLGKLAAAVGGVTGRGWRQPIMDAQLSLLKL